jgi:hypothetical protein
MTRDTFELTHDQNVNSDFRAQPSEKSCLYPAENDDGSFIRFVD